MKNLQNVTLEEAQEVLESEDLRKIRDYLDNHSFGWSWEMSEMCEKIIKVQLRLMQEETGEDEKKKNGTYYWAKNGRGDDMLIIVTSERSWSWGKNVIEALEMMKDYYPNMSIEAATELERRKLACSYCDYIEEFEVLKQTPEYKSLEEAYKNRAR